MSLTDLLEQTDRQARYEQDDEAAERGRRAIPPQADPRDTRPPRSDGMPAHWPFPERWIMEYYARHPGARGEPPRSVE